MEKITYEMTDTFGGEANYSWVRRGEVEVTDKTSELSLIRKVKSALDLSGVPCRKEYVGGDIWLKPWNANVVVFINLN